MLACTTLAAMVGVVGATEVTMGMIALPAMLRRGYDDSGVRRAAWPAARFGILIPPSVMAIVYSVVAQQSLGELLAGSILPGLLLSGLLSPTSPAMLHQSRARPRLCRRQERVAFPREAAGCSKHDGANHPDLSSRSA